MGRHILSAVIGAVCGLMFMLVVTGGVVVLGHDSVIHALKGKTGAEYTSLSNTLDQTKSDLATANSDLTKTKSDLATANSLAASLQTQISNLNTKVNGLQGQLDSWNALLCAHSWAEATNPNIALVLNNNDGSLRKVFNMLGFDAYGTQWTTNVDPNSSFELLVKPLAGKIILDVSKECVILESPVGPSA